MALLRKDYQDFCAELIGNPDRINNPQWQAAARAYHEKQLAKCLKLLPRKMRDERRLVQSLLSGKPHQQVVMALPRKLLRLFLSACQADLFDRLLSSRLPNLHILQQGDIAYKHANGACFRVEDTQLEQPRADRLEISPTAPLFGFKTMQAEQLSGEAEQAVLNATGLTAEAWKLKHGLAMPGERRPLRVPLQQAAVKKGSKASITLTFSLPKGSYATSVLQEIIK
jgi:tRNA pseudouridine13 synthase